MNLGPHEKLLQLLEELGAIQGVRGALLAVPGGAFAGGKNSGLASEAAEGVAKTVRRMVVASTNGGLSGGRASDQLWSPRRMLVAPLREDSTLVVLLERDTAGVCGSQSTRPAG